MAFRGGTDPPLFSEKKLTGFRFFVGRFGKIEKLAGFRVLGFESWQVFDFLLVSLGNLKSWQVLGF